MGARGPKPGWKASPKLVTQAATRKADKAARRAAREAAQQAALAAPAPAADADKAMGSWVADQNNPRYLSGDKLKDFAHRKGIARTDLLTMSDVKIREQIRYIEARRYGETAEA